VSWSGSNNHMFGAWIQNPLFGVTGASGAGLPTGYQGLIADTVKVALFNNTTTPDQTVNAAQSGYNTGQWVTANEVTGGTDWVAGGRALSSETLSYAGGATTYRAANLASAATVTFTAYGCLVYDASITGGTVANQGVCFLDFGGAQVVTAGTFSITWSNQGIFALTA
jgi:hypothetical protein